MSGERERKKNIISAIRDPTIEFLFLNGRYCIELVENRLFQYCGEPVGKQPNPQELTAQWTEG